jgi:thioredoxin reductase (NADPH)
LYLERYRRRTVIIDAGDPRAQWIPRIRNLIGYAEGISGEDLLRRLHKQLSKVKTGVIAGHASVRRTGDAFDVAIGDSMVRARKVIVATGMQDIQPELSNLDDLRRKGMLAYCPVCDGYDHSDEHVALMIDGSDGLKKLRFMAALTPKLHIIVTRPLAVSPFYRKEIERLDVKLHPSPVAALQSSRGAKKLIVRLKNRRSFSVRLAYVALGTHVDRSATRHIHGLKRTKAGFIITSSHQETSIPGLYAVGDCVNSLSQVSVAVGHAAIAATRVHHDLGF